MLTLNNINLQFGKNHVLKNVSCMVESGDFIVIVGTNGAGKSSLFDTIAGKIKPTSGTIFLENVNITSYNELQRTSMITRLFQNIQLNSIGSLTVSQNLAIAQYSRRNARFVDGMQAMPLVHAKELINTVGMDPSITEKRMDTLSGGQRQLIAFIMATQKIPQLLLLDEPTAALDPQATTILLEYVVKFIKKHRIKTLMITHDPHIALSIGNIIWVLENGTITKKYSLEEKKYLNPHDLIGHVDYEKLAHL